MSGKAVEICGDVDTMILDKTGTITAGKPVVTDVIVANGFTREELMQTACSIEQFSTHPLATAILKDVKVNGFTPDLVEKFAELPGKGVTGVVRNQTVFAGNKRLLKELDIDTSWVEKQSEKLAFEGKTPLFFVRNGSVIGIIAVADMVKSTSKLAIEQFKKLGIKVIMLTGDNLATATAIGRQVGVDKVIGEVLPQDKEQTIKDLQDNGELVAMIGDGVNDAPALARADVGIAIGAGMDIAIESADIVLMKSDLLDATTAIKLSKAVIGNIKGNLFWAFFYNIIGIPLAAGVFYSLLGWKLNPMIGAAAMSMSSICVVTNALRLKRFKPYTSIERVASMDEILNEESKKEVKVMTKVIKIEGMMCGHCTGRVDQLLNTMEHVTATVSLEDQSATVTMTIDVDNQVFIDGITAAGYTVISIV